jgi:hypothetical protein
MKLLLKNLLGIICILLALTCSISLPVFAVTPAVAQSTIEKLEKICTITPVQKENLITELSIDSADRNRISKLEAGLRSAANICVDKELLAHVKQVETTEEFEKLKGFLEIITPIQAEIETSPQYNSVNSGVFVISLVTQINRLIESDRWISLPDITGRWTASDAIEQQLKNSFYDNNEVSSPKKDNFINFKPIIDYIRNTLYIILATSFAYFVFLSLFQKDKFNYLTKNISKVAIRFAFIPVITIVASLGILFSNLCVTVIYNAVNQADFCPTTSGLECIISQTSRTVQKMDFIKLPKDKLQTNVKGKQIDIFNLQNFDWAEVGWGIYYIILFLIIGGGTLYFGAMLVFSQIIIFLKLYIWYFVSLFNLLNPHADPIQSVKKISELITQAIANAGIYIFGLFIIFNLFKDGVSLRDVFIIVTILGSMGTLMAYFCNVTNVKYNDKKPPLFNYGTQKKGVTGAFQDLGGKLLSISPRISGASGGDNLKNIR